MSINSHIQIPNCILKNFRSANGKVNYLKLDTGNIGSCGSGNLGTELGYYSKEMEQYLNKEIESPFALLVSKVLSFVSNKNKLTLPASIEDNFKRYVTAAMARSNQAFDSFSKNSITAAFLDAQTNRDDLVFFSTQKNGGIHPIIQNHRMLVIHNQSKRQFVVPRNCFFCIQNGSPIDDWIIAPVSPECAFALVPDYYPRSFVDGEECHLCLIHDDESILMMNKRALVYEYVFNKSFVAAADVGELHYLKEFLEENKKSLDATKKELIENH